MMKAHKQINPSYQPQQDTGPGYPGSEENLDAFRTEVNRLFTVADTAFNRIKTRDSQGFLDQSKQTGGQ